MEKRFRSQRTVAKIGNNSSYVEGDFVVNSVISDLIEGAILLKACVESCVVNMNINLRNIENNEILEIAKNVKDNKIQEFYKDVAVFVTRNNQKI